MARLVGEGCGEGRGRFSVTRGQSVELETVKLRIEVGELAGGYDVSG